jgi:type VI secretion system secreted protein VgrG
MPPWQLPGQQALSGLRSRELGGGTRGNHLILDDTAGKIQAQLKSDHLCSQLSLGHITRIEDTKGRKDARGEGWELRTDGHGVVRAAMGMLITTEARQGARGAMKDIDETSRRLNLALEQHRLLGEIAQKTGAQETSSNQENIALSLKTQNEAIAGPSSAKGGFPELAAPHLVLASPSGIATTTAGDTHIASDAHTAMTTGKDLSLAAGMSLFATVRQTFRVLVQKAGMKIVAAAGDIDLQALSDNINLLAKLSITQTADRIVISAKDDIVINGGGSYVKFTADGIECGTHGTFVAHAASHSLTTAKGMEVPDIRSPSFSAADQNADELEQYFSFEDKNGKPLSGFCYRLDSMGQKLVEGVFDEKGQTQAFALDKEIVHTSWILQRQEVPK